jgi:hypothetical protein
MTALNQAYRRVATRDEAAAEDTSQAAPRATIHAFFPGADKTLCGRWTNDQVQSMGVLRVVSCTECREALVAVGKRNSRDGRAAAVERQVIRERQESDAVNATADTIKQTNIERDAAALNKLRACCGYVENGSQEPLTISQDDATKGWSIRIGTERIASTVPLKMHKPRSYHADGFHEVIDTAYRAEKQEF